MYTACRMFAGGGEVGAHAGGGQATGKAGLDWGRVRRQRPSGASPLNPIHLDTGGLGQADWPENLPARGPLLWWSTSATLLPPAWPGRPGLLGGRTAPAGAACSGRGRGGASEGVAAGMDQQGRAEQSQLALPANVGSGRGRQQRGQRQPQQYQTQQHQKQQQQQQQQGSSSRRQ